MVQRTGEGSIYILRVKVRLIITVYLYERNRDNTIPQCPAAAAFKVTHVEM